MDWDSYASAHVRRSGGGSGGALSWKRLYYLDFRAEPTTPLFFQAGAQVIAGKTWYFRDAGYKDDVIPWKIYQGTGLTWGMSFGYGGSPGDYGAPGTPLVYPHWVFHLDQVSYNPDLPICARLRGPNASPAGCAFGLVSTGKHIGILSAAERVYDAFVHRYAWGPNVGSKMGDAAPQTGTAYASTFAGMAILCAPQSGVHYVAGTAGSAVADLAPDLSSLVFSPDGQGAFSGRPQLPRPSPALCLMPYMSGASDGGGAITEMDIWQWS